MKFDPTIVQTRVASPLGNIILAATASGLAGLWFAEGQRYLPSALAASPAAQPPEGAERTPAASRRTPPWPDAPDHPLLKQASAQLAEYFAGQRRHFELPLDLSGGTAFQQSVWRALLEIAPGSTVSYSHISARIGKPGAVRAVGAAIGRNPVSLIVPCHRVLGASGALTGYAGGLDRKAALLRLEGALQEKLL